MNLDVSYSKHLSQYLIDPNDHDFSIIYKIRTPPYIISRPSVRFTDLEPMWDLHIKIFLFTRGVDHLVDGDMVSKSGEHSGADPVYVVGALLADQIDPRTDATLGHRVVPRWSDAENNRAKDVLGNLLGGADVDRLETVTVKSRIHEGLGRPFHIEDTSIIVWSKPRSS
ncbi:hypothetical protein C2E23DRAFT_881915 [Lenzites betulinus]|nr:hypothetical protein C2E23DRAFT_881915 [Lenzites betulinus]